jgi:tetratricopeptide (TPR) repeat protein
MDTVRVAFEVPEDIIRELNRGTYERVGGVIRDTQSKQVVSWLRETTPEVAILSQIGSVASILNLGFSALNLAVSVTGFSRVLKRLDKIEKKLEQIKEILVKHHQELANKIDFSLYFSVYANFRAALNLANTTFTMANVENRRASAMQAINRFLEAEEHYKTFADEELRRQGRATDEFLLTLSLAYIAEARCYLELEELPTARHRLQEAADVLRPRFVQQINTLLTSNPSAYLHPELKDEVNLTRLTRVYQWLNPGIDENTVFQEQRKNLFKLAHKPEEWKNSLPIVIWHYIDYKGMPGTFRELSKVMEKIEALIESYHRIQAYQVEIQAIEELGMTFHDWLKLASSAEVKPEGSELMYILPDKKLDLELAPSL